MKRTSVTHPLYIDEINADPGTIGITLCPGKKYLSVYGPQWDRDLQTDLDAIDAWKPDAVVCLIEDHEFKMLQVESMGADIAARGIVWLHLPIRDMDIPDHRFENLWASVGKTLQAILSAGGRVLIHCRGGLGRAGTFAARILIENGMSAGEAIELVRVARPGAIETNSQEKYLRRNLRFLAHASLKAGAMGDSLGAEIEFMDLTSIRTRFPAGLTELLPHRGVLGAITDDTQMTLFTAEGIILAEKPESDAIVASVHRALLRWYDTQVDRDKPGSAGIAADHRLRHQRAPGNTCMGSLANVQQISMAAYNNSKGCGTIMRVAPVAFGIPRQNIREIAIRTSALTHGHPTGQLAAAAWAELLADVAAGDYLDATALRLVAQYRDLPNGKETADALHAAFSAKRDNLPETVEKLGGGWVAEEALAIALYSALATDNFEDGLRCAVTHSGDSDSTGAIAGNLLGIMYPDEALAHRWASQVECADLIFDLSRDLIKVRQERGL